MLTRTPEPAKKYSKSSSKPVLPQTELRKYKRVYQNDYKREVTKLMNETKKNLTADLIEDSWSSGVKRREQYLRNRTPEEKSKLWQNPKFKKIKRPKRFQRARKISSKKFLRAIRFRRRNIEQNYESPSEQEEKYEYIRPGEIPPEELPVRNKIFGVEAPSPKKSKIHSPILIKENISNDHFELEDVVDPFEKDKGSQVLNEFSQYMSQLRRRYVIRRKIGDSDTPDFIYEGSNTTLIEKDYPNIFREKTEMSSSKVLSDIIQDETENMKEAARVFFKNSDIDQMIKRIQSCLAMVFEIKYIGYLTDIDILGRYKLRLEELAEKELQALKKDERQHLDNGPKALLFDSVTQNYFKRKEIKEAKELRKN
ncbi:unnamed protein product [Moneuplotes crassus]|uniref:Uncharacterized protein n=1 Tax=Euplotes crassus TaxID=5936 RepID=A0AAD1Y4M9_EUPCR|nr:unnamed protein product [Moneuplotes crassus]